ncbi:MAG: hypothetical protein V3W11_09620 [bacterium]
MKVSKITALAVVAALAWWSAAPALAEEEDDEESPGTTEENIRYYYGQGNNPFSTSSAEEEEEVFSFGKSEQEDFVELKWSRFQDTSGKASRDIKRIIGITLITTALTMAGWAIFLNTDQIRPDNWQKIYEGTGVVVSTREHAVNGPTVVAGVCLAGSGLWLMRYK